MSFFNSASTNTANTTGAAALNKTDAKDMENLVMLADSSTPTDGISSIAWSPQADILAAGSWSNEIRIYEVDANTGATNLKLPYVHEQPVLEVCWSKDGTKLFSGGCDKAGRMFDVSTGQATQVAAHDGPIRRIQCVEAPGQSTLVATGSWDKTIRYWDLRQQTPAGTIQLPERVYTMDAVHPLMVVGTAGRKIHIYNLNSPTTEWKSLDSPLKWQTRSLACFNDATGYAMGSIEGRCAIQHVEEKQSSSNFSFKCHRKDTGAGTSRLASQPTQIFAVNDIKFHRQQGTFATAGSDGTINMWDKDSKTRLKTFESQGGPLTSVSFNRTGAIFAYAISYDWSQGHAGATPSVPNKIMLHALKAEDINKRPKKK